VEAEQPPPATMAVLRGHPPDCRLLREVVVTLVDDQRREIGMHLHDRLRQKDFDFLTSCTL
jgi:hypothetical protein